MPRLEAGTRMSGREGRIITRSQKKVAGWILHAMRQKRYRTVLVV